MVVSAETTQLQAGDEVVVQLLQNMNFQSRAVLEV